MFSELQDELILAFTSQYKDILYEFVETYSPYDEIRNEYLHMNKEDFDSYYNEALQSYMG